MLSSYHHYISISSKLYIIITPKTSTRTCVHVTAAVLRSVTRWIIHPQRRWPQKIQISHVIQMVFAKFVRVLPLSCFQSIHHLQPYFCWYPCAAKKDNRKWWKFNLSLDQRYSFELEGTAVMCFLCRSTPQPGWLRSERIFNTARPEQRWLLIADDIFKRVSLKWSIWIWLWFSLFP